MMFTDDEHNDIKRLAFTSVDDMRSSYKCKPEAYSIPVLKQVLRIATQRGEKTRAKMVAAWIRARLKAITVKGRKPTTIIIDDPFKDMSTEDLKAVMEKRQPIEEVIEKGLVDLYHELHGDRHVKR